MPQHTRPLLMPLASAVVSLCLYLALPTAHAEKRIAAKPSGFTLLAESLIDADESARWAFADNMLAVLLETYGEELQTAALADIRNTKRRAKLRRWRRATANLVERLNQARLRLSEGTSATLHVDEQRQVLLFIGREAVAFSPPRPGSEQRMQARVMERYCAVYDCSILDGIANDVPLPARGAWSMSAHRPPAYEIDGQVRCEFIDLTERSDKQIACEAAARESLLLDDTLAQAVRDGFEVDWKQLAGHRPTAAPEVELKVTASGDYLRLSIPHLARLNHDDWSALARWLGRRRNDTGDMLVIHHGNRLLSDDR